MAVQSKLIDPLTVTCHEYLHPWTKSCVSGSAGMLLGSIEPTLKTYVTFYLLALAMRMRIPKLKDLKHTLQGILRSTAFLCTNAYGFIMWTCILRHAFGRFYFPTVAFVPTFLGALMAISIERAERRAPLTLYVANVGTETLWNMAKARGWVRSMPNGQVLIFGLSVSALLYLYRLGLHTSIAKDATFKVLGLLAGKEEAGPLKSNAKRTRFERSSRRLDLTTITGLVQAYSRLVDAKHDTCAHRQSCIKYAVLGGLKPFAGGVGLQVGLKLLMNITKVITLRMQWRKEIFNKKNLQIGLFLGGFSFLYKSVSCALRHALDRDDPRFAIPAGLIGSLAFTQFPNVTIALYIMWKALHLYYNCGTHIGLLPVIPNFVMYMFSFFTATLFHACILEADSLRPSYYKFLQGISGERVSRFDVRKFDAFGHNSYRQHKDAYTKLKIDMSSILPNVPITE